MIQKISLIANVILLVATLVLGGVLLIGCGFKPIQIKGENADCNDMYNIMWIITKEKDKDNALVTIAYQDCKKARAEIKLQVKQNNCRDLWYGVGKPIDKTKYETYQNYTDCVNK